MKVPWQRRPYQAALAMVLAAVLLNAWVGNMLWLGYSIGGIALVAIIMALDATYRWHLPDRLLWWCAIPLAMHYMGGSLSGLHQWGTNGLYYALPWWDNLVHFLGAGAAGIAAAHILQPLVGFRRTATIVLATCVAAAIGLAVEVYEFTGFLWFGTIDQGYYTNTVLDLYYNTLGGFAGAWLWTRPTGTTQSRQAPVPQ